MNNVMDTEKLKNKKHLKTRLIATAIVLVPFLLYGLFYTETPREFNGHIYHQRSCLGNPAVLPYALIGVPSLLLFAALDVLVLVILKKINWYKVIVNITIAFIVFLSIFLVPF